MAKDPHLDRKQESDLFDYLARHRPLKDWLESQVAEQVRILKVNPNLDQLLKAQGQVQCLQLMLDKLVAAESAARRN